MLTHARGEDWAPNLTFVATWHDNASNSNAAIDKIRAVKTEADLIASQRYAFGPNDSLHPAVRFSGEWWPLYEGLTQGGAGAGLQWRHHFGAGPLAPVLFVDFGGDVVTAKEGSRRGTSTRVMATLRKRFDDAWRATLTHEFARHDARAAVFDRKGSESAIEIDRDLTAMARLTLRASFRDGDVLSYATPPRPDLVALASHQREVDTFDRPMVAYSIDARTTAIRAGFVGALDARSALILGYEWRLTRKSTLRYVNQLVSAAVVYQF